MTEFEEDCLHFHGKILTGKYKHFCHDFDLLPLDETCSEFEYCHCFDDVGELPNSVDQK
jgi:hypothetical protein